MKYEIRHPHIVELERIDNLLMEDYRKSGINNKPPLTDDQINYYSRRAWAAYNDSEEPEAIILTGQWNWKTAAPYSHIPERVLRTLGKAGYFEGQVGIYVMSAMNYDENGPLAALVDQTDILEPKAGSVHVPLLKSELGARAFLLDRGFSQGRDGLDRITWLPDKTVLTVLMTRKK